MRIKITAMWGVLWAEYPSSSKGKTSRGRVRLFWAYPTALSTCSIAPMSFLNQLDSILCTNIFVSIKMKLLSFAFASCSWQQYFYICSSSKSKSYSATAEFFFEKSRSWAVHFFTQRHVLDILSLSWRRVSFWARGGVVIERRLSLGSVASSLWALSFADSEMSVGKRKFDSHWTIYSNCSTQKTHFQNLPKLGCVLRYWNSSFFECSPHWKSTFETLSSTNN